MVGINGKKQYYLFIESARYKSKRYKSNRYKFEY